MKTGIFKPAPPFSSFQSVFTNATIVGSLMGIYGLSSKTLEVARRKDDVWNSLFACGVTYQYYNVFLGFSEQRLIIHNRAVAVMIASSLLYANVII